MAVTIYLRSEAGDTLTTELPDRLRWETASVGLSAVTGMATTALAGRRIDVGGTILSSFTACNLTGHRLTVGVTAIAGTSAMTSDAVRITITSVLVAISCILALRGGSRWSPDEPVETLWYEQTSDAHIWNEKTTGASLWNNA
jgi:hypothetical protein